MLRLKVKNIQKVRNRVIKVLTRWAERGASRTLRRVMPKMVRHYKNLMNSGREPTKPMVPVSEATLNMPVRLGDGNTTPRRRYNPSRNLPIKATGKTISSLRWRKLNKNEYHIDSGSSKGNMILYFNATKRQFGRERKLVRDPLRLAKKEMDMIEDGIVKDLDKILARAF